MTVVLGIVAILVIVNPIVQGVLTAVQLGVTTDESFAWRAEGCPVHALDGSVRHFCPETAEKLKHRRAGMSG